MRISMRDWILDDDSILCQVSRRRGLGCVELYLPRKWGLSSLLRQPCRDSFIIQRASLKVDLYIKLLLPLTQLLLELCPVSITYDDSTVGRSLLT